MLAIIFDSVGAGEWLVLLAVLLVVMGPKRLPATARQIGAYYSKFRRAAESFKRQLMDMDLEMEREFQKVEREAQEAVASPEEVGGSDTGVAAEQHDYESDVPRDYEYEGDATQAEEPKVEEAKAEGAGEVTGGH